MLFNYFKKLFFVLLLAPFLTGCNEEEDDERATMCYELQGNTLYLNCYTDAIHSCSEDGKSSIGSYGNWDACYDDMQNVLDVYQNTGNIKPGPNSDEGAGSGGSSSGNCGSSGYNGPEFDIQVDSQCKAAYAYLCAGNQQGADAACAIYRQWQEDDSSIPDCPYCD